jgi:ribose transport system permease protein
MMTIARGLAFALAARVDMTFPRDARPGWVDALARANDPTFYFYPGFWLLLVLSIAVAVLMHRTVLGRYVFALGSNEATARLCGVPVARTRIAIYGLAGLLIGMAGILSFAQLGSGTPGGNIGLELEVIAAVVIGGARLTGGQGTVTGTMLGVLTMGVLAIGVTACEVSVEVKAILVGFIIIAMMALSQWRRTR